MSVDFLKIETLGGIVDTVDLTSEADMIAALFATAKAWPALKAQLGAVNDGTSVLQWLDDVSTIIDSPAVKTAFKKAGLENSHTGVARFVDKWRGQIDTLGRSQWAKLFNRLDRYVEDKDHPDIGMVRWTPFSFQVAAPAGHASTSFHFGSGGDLNLDIESGAQWLWPYNQPVIARPMLRLGLAGSIKADAGASATVHAVTIGASAAADAGARLDYYYDVPDRTEIFGLAAGRHLAGLPNPFDLASIWKAFASSDLAGIDYAFDGTMTAGVEVGIGTEAEIRDVAAISAGLTVAASIERSLRYQVSFRSLSAPTAGGGGRPIEMVISRKGGSSSTIGIDLKVGIDLNALGKRVRAIAVAELNKLNAIRADIEPFLSPGTYLRNRASAQLAGLIDGVSTEPALKTAALADVHRALGQAGDAAGVAQWLTDQLTGLLDSGAGALAKDAGTAATALTEALVARLPTPLGAPLEQRLKEVFVQAIDDAEAGLKSAVTTVIAGAGVADKIKADLEKLGIKVTTAANALDATLARVRALLRRFDELTAQMFKEAEDDARLKVTLEVLSSETRTKADSYLLTAQITADTPEARGTISQLLFGAGGGNELVARLFRDGGVPGMKIDPAQSALSRLVGRQSKFGYTLTLFGFGVSGGLTLDSRAAVTRTGDGRITVASDGTLRNWRTQLDGSDELLLHSRAAVAIARNESVTDRLFNVDIGINRGDNRLKRDELARYLGSLAPFGPGAVAAGAAAASAFDAWAPPGSKGSLPIDLSLGLSLSGKALDNLMLLGERTAGSLSLAAQRRIFAIGYAALRAVKIITDQDEKNWLGFARHEVKQSHLPQPLLTAGDYFYNFRDLSSTMETLYGTSEQDLDRRQMVAEMGGTPWGSGAGVGRKQNGTLHNLVDLIDALGDLYDATPIAAGGAVLTEVQYEALHRRVLDASRGWLRLPQTLQRMLFVSDEVAPRVLAYLLAIRALAGGPGAALSLSITMVDAGGGKDHVFATSTAL